MDKVTEWYLLGKAIGILEGISWRSDCPTEVKAMCKQAVEEFDKYQKEEK